LYLLWSRAFVGLLSATLPRTFDHPKPPSISLLDQFDFCQNTVDDSQSTQTASTSCHHRSKIFTQLTMAHQSEFSDELDGFLSKLGGLMPPTIPTPTLLDLSNKLTSSLMDGVQTSTASMIPCPIYRLPSGHETGTFLSVDLGGSTLRVALV